MKIRNGLSIAPPICRRYIFCVQTIILILSSHYDASTKEISIIQNPFNCATEDLLLVLHLEVSHLQCNDTIKGKHKKKNLMKVYECFDMNMLN